MKILQIILFIFISSCGQEVVQETKKPKDSTYSPQAPISYDADIVMKQGFDLSYDGKELFNSDVSSGYTFQLQGAPDWLSINSSTGELTGEPQDNGIHEDIKIRAIKVGIGSDIDSEDFSIGVNGDPLRKYAWHLTNTGQKAFSNSAGTSGVDVNVYGAFQKGYTGNGVRVVISDSGVEINHDDLYLNALDDLHKNYTSSSPYYGTPTPTTAHGTAVAGIILATGWNNRGSIGIAPKAKFAGYQFLSSPQSASILMDQADGNFDIYNYSYGETYYHDTRSDEDYLDLIKDGFLNDKKIYVKSSGNEFIQVSESTCVSHNANIPLEHESPFMMVVGAVDADGKKAFYSNAGSNLWVVGTGGDTGSSAPAIMTTDLPTCFKGYSKSNSVQTNEFEYGHSKNTQCHYTSTMNGTSASAPSVSGVIALIKEANPALSARDIKHILASTSTKVDPAFVNDWQELHPSEVYESCTDLGLTNHTYEQGWIENDAGYSFSNFYGFGLVNADAAVSMAEGYSSSLGTFKETNPDFDDPDYYSGILNLSIPDNSSSGRSTTMNITDDLTIEAVQIEVNIDHAASGELGVELTSPKNTKSILLNINNSLLLDGDEDLNTRLLTNAFYGENAQGTWTLKVIDGKNSNTGTLNSWKINILGH